MIRRFHTFQTIAGLLSSAQFWAVFVEAVETLLEETNLFFTANKLKKRLKSIQCRFI